MQERNALFKELMGLGLYNNSNLAEIAEGEVKIDPTDVRIDVRAKFSLQRMLKQGGAAAQDATGMINAINNSQLAGIDGDNTLRAVNVAKQLGTQRWLLVSKGRDADLVYVPVGPPSIIFRDGVDKNQSRFDEALRSAWSTFKPVQVRIPPYQYYPPDEVPPRYIPINYNEQSFIPIIIVPGILGTRLIEPGTNEMVWNPFFPMTVPFEDGFGVVALNFERLSDIAKPLLPAHNSDIRVAHPNFEKARRIPNFGNLNYSSYHKLAFELNSEQFDTYLRSKNPKSPKGIRVYACGYDWRQNTLNSAATLQKVVDQAIIDSGSPSTKVILIAHSMGGIVSRQFCSPDGLGQASKVESLILLASPTHGAPAAYKLLKEGKLFSDINFFKEAVTFSGRNIFNKVSERFLGKILFPKNFSDIVRSFPSVYELLPNRNFCKNNKNWVKFDINDTKSLRHPNGINDASDPQKLYENEFVGIVASSFDKQKVIEENLDKRNKMDNLISNYMPKPTHALFTQALDTEIGYTVQKQIYTGKPFLEPEELKDGDGRVPLYSAIASGVNNVIEIFSISSNPEHGKVPNNPEVIKKIKKIIEQKLSIMV